MRCLFLNLDTNVLVLLFSCAPGPPTLSILVSLRCSVKGVVHSVVLVLQFLGNFSHGIALISQKKNRLTSFKISYLFLAILSLYLNPNADAPDTQLIIRAQGKTQMQTRVADGLSF